MQAVQRKAYIAGPMRGYKDLNFPAFDAAAKIGKASGYITISPADMDRQAGVNESELNVSTLTPAMIREFVIRDMEAIIFQLRAENEDAIALLPGWQSSTGARAELGVALWLGLKVLDARTFLPLNAKIFGLETRPPLPAQFQSCGLNDGLCGIERDMQEMSLIACATDIANREKV